MYQFLKHLKWLNRDKEHKKYMNHSRCLFSLIGAVTNTILLSLEIVAVASVLQ